jgi:hypothetical protein
MVVRDEDLAQIADHTSVPSHHSITNLSPAQSDGNQINPDAQESPTGAHQVTQDAEAPWQSQGDPDPYDDVVLDLSGDGSHIPSLDLEAVIGSLAVHVDPLDHFIDDAVLDFGLNPMEDGQEEGELEVNDTDEPQTADQILSRFSGSSSLPPSPSDPFEQYLFCHCKTTPFPNVKEPGQQAGCKTWKICQCVFTLSGQISTHTVRYMVPSPLDLLRFEAR